MFGWTMAGLCWVAALGADPVAAEAAAKRGEQLAAALSHADYTVRQQATAKLLASDPKQALADVLAVIETGRPEATIRATEVLTAWYGRPEMVTEELENAVESLLAKTGAVHERTTIAWETHRTAREQRAVARLQELGAKVVFQTKKESELGIDVDVEVTGTPTIQHIVIGKSWRGGDDGLKYIARLSRIQNGIYRVKTAKVSEEALQKFTDANPELRVEVRGAFLGVTYSTQQFGFGGMPTCRISEVAPKSPAEKAGLKMHDEIIKFGDKDVQTFPDLIDHLKATEPGEKVLFTVLRDGKETSMTVELGDW